MYASVPRADENRRGKKPAESNKKEKTSCLEHVLRRNYLQLRIIEKKVEGKRGRGRRKVGMLDDVRNERG